MRFVYTNGKVSHYDEYSGGQTGVQCDISYPSYTRTVYLDYGNDRIKGTSDDILTHYLFDYAGRTANSYTTDKDGETVLGASNAVHSANANTDKTNNRTLRTASIGVAAMNLMRNGGLDASGSGWYFNGSASRSTDVKRTGTASLKGTLPGSASYVHSTRSVTGIEEGKTYTLSAYVNTNGVTSFTGTGAYIAVQSASGTTWKSEPINYQTPTSINSGWIRLSVTFTATTTETHHMVAYSFGTTGSVYFDDFQLELAEAPSNRNMLENGNMQYSDLGWTFGTGASYNTDTEVTSTQHIKITGSPANTAANATQVVQIGLPGTSTFVLSGWACANAVPDNMNAATDSAQDLCKQFGLRAIITYSDNTKEYHYTAFNPDLTDWQFTSLTIVPKEPTKTISTISVVCAYEGNANVAYFDNLSLVQEVAQTMKYDENGNLKSVTSTGLNSDENIYQGGNLIQTVTGGNGEYTYKYEDSNNSRRVSSITNGTLTQNMEYDGVGNVIGTTLKNGDSPIMESSTEYTSNGNLLYTVTDSAGVSTTYNYASATNKMFDIPSSIVSATDVTTTYTTDTFGRIRQLFVEDFADVKYTYLKTRLHEVQRTDDLGRTQIYHFNYDNFDNMTELLVGNTALATYEYASNNGVLTKQSYGNGDAIFFTYDNLGRIKTETYSDGRVLTYTYTGDGQLFSTHDSKTGFLYLYTYDTIGRLIACTVKDGGNTILTSRRVYNENNQLIKNSWQVGDATYSEIYSYNVGTGTVSTMTTGDGTTLAMSYDDLLRLTGVSVGDLYNRTYTYRDLADGKTTNQTSKVSYSGIDAAPYYEYTYNSLGNIATYKDTNKATFTYTYDDQDQLLQATDGTNTYTYTYDSAGNILTANGHTYAYSTGDWKDLLVSFDGQTIAYDGSGNPTSYYNGTRWAFTWEEGRRLTYAAANGKGYTYAYDMNGLRTSKTVNGTAYSFIYTDGTLLRQSGDGKILDFVYDNNGMPHALVYNNGTTTQTYYYITNLQGDVMYLVDADGATVASYTYDPYGNILSAEGTMADINPLRYRGYYYDSETGFYYLQSRYYDPATCRYINADEYSDTGDGVLGYNMFAYCMNNPINRTDASGTWSLPNWAKVAIGVAIIATAAVVTVATGGAAAGPIAAAVHCAAQGALVGAVTQGAAGAVQGAITGAISHRINTGSWDGAGQAALDGAADGFLEGTITGAISGAVNSPYCFIAGTLVQTEDGAQAIETIQAGDRVWAWDENTGDVAIKEVVETYVNYTDELVHVYVAGEEIITTPSHPFYSPVKGWTDACHLRAGDILVLLNGEYVVVELVQHEVLEAPIEVYNFQVEGYHTYYVSDAGVLVHNSCHHDKKWKNERRSFWRSKARTASVGADYGPYVATSENIARMKRGAAPIGWDGFSVELHHVEGIVNNFDNYVPVSKTLHDAIHTFS